MKKLSIFSALLVGAFLFAACDADRDDNPVLDLTKTQDPITMNTPTFAGGFYDLQNTDTIFFACTAPNYGFPATVTYALEVSIDEDMSNPTRLTTTYSKNGMDVASREVAIGVTKQMMDKKQLKQEDFPVETPIYMRIHAYIDGVEGTDTYSNVVKFNKVKTGFALPYGVITGQITYDGRQGVPGVLVTATTEDEVPVPQKVFADTVQQGLRALNIRSLKPTDRSNVGSSKYYGTQGTAMFWIRVSEYIRDSYHTNVFNLPRFAIRLTNDGRIWTEGHSSDPKCFYSSKLALNEWYHIAVSYTKDTAYIYLNGKYEGKHPYTPDYYPAIFGIGDYKSKGYEMADIRVYNYRMDSTEIRNSGRRYIRHHRYSLPRSGYVLQSRSYARHA